MSPRPPAASPRCLRCNRSWTRITTLSLPRTTQRPQQTRSRCEYMFPLLHLAILDNGHESTTNLQSVSSWHALSRFSERVVMFGSEESSARSCRFRMPPCFTGCASGSNKNSGAAEGKRANNRPRIIAWRYLPPGVDGGRQNPYDTDILRSGWQNRPGG